MAQPTPTDNPILLQPLPASPGDVLVVRTGGIAAQWIRFGSMLLQKDDLENHVAVVHHIDAAGTTWGIEGRPGGVGWVDCSSYLHNAFTLANYGQTKTIAQRLAVCATMEKILGTKYDWQAIAEDGVEDLHIPDPWRERWGPGNVVPGHVVCSSAAVVGYEGTGLAYPECLDPAHIQPCDWADFIVDNHYDH
jgi:hypothetical protein